ncbi:hypothetical protein BSLG_007349 [Batrachochytrium salamandrivorans]|nr:hypothetical protein BSLG_007349 [Batrachochytrium salamandrivorans]
MIDISVPPSRQRTMLMADVNGLSETNNDMEICSTNVERQLVTPGEVITRDSAFMRGHGTFTEEQTLMASVAGVVERVNKLVSVKPLKSRYNGEIGDVVVGRISERRKSESDELQMRTFFAEGDLLSAEVQAFFGDGAASLHTRSIKYGKLRNGSLVTVPSAQIKRSKSHFITLPCGVDIVLGVNGYIWVSKHLPVDPDLTNQPDGLYSNENETISTEDREAIARVCNVITVLGRQNCEIHESAIVYAFDASLDYPVKDLLKTEIQETIVRQASALLREANNQ